MSDQPVFVFLWHKTEEPDGKRFPIEAVDGLLARGYVDTPEKFNPNYVPPPLPDGARRDAAGRVVVVKHFPSYRFNRLGDSRRVESAAEAEALDPAEWKDTPDPAAFEPRSAGSASAPVVAPVTAPPASAPATPGEMTEDEEKRAAALVSAAQALHAMTVPDVIESLKGADVEALRKTQQMEALNPSPRNTLLAFINKAIKEATAA